MSQRVPRRYWTAILGLVALAFAVTLGATVRFWLAPWQPLIALACLGVAPVAFWAFVGAFVLDPTRTRQAIVGSEAPPLSERFRLALLPVAVAALPALGLAASWRVADVRAVVVEVAGAQRLTAGVAGALVDPHADVRLAACRSLEAGGAGAASLELGGRLADPDERVVDCALAAMQPGAVDGVAVSLASAAWTSELVRREDLPAERACQLAARVRSTERLGLDHAPLALFQCGLSAASAEGRECCAQAFRASLGNASPSMVLPSPATLVRTALLGSVPQLVSLAFSRDDRQVRQRQQLRLHTPQEQAWALAVGCEALSQGLVARHPVSRAMADAIHGDTCEVEPATESTVRVWTAACSTVFDDDARDIAEAAPQALCHAVRGALTADAANTAQRQVMHAVRTGEHPDRRYAMLQLLLDYSAKQAASAPHEAEDERAAAAPWGSQSSSLMNLLLQMGRPLDAQAGEVDPAQLELFRAVHGTLDAR